MAHLWIQDAGSWDAVRLGGAEFDLAGLAAQQEPEAEPASAAAGAARLFRIASGELEVWSLITSRSSDVRVNSQPLHTGLRVLADRDEIRTGNRIHYFSTETLATVQPFPRENHPVYCGRCRQQIEVGALAVSCPNCGIWYNQSADLPCWTYASKCTFCGHPTALDTGFSWTPEED